MGPSRSLVKLAQKLGKPSGYTRHLEAWSSTYRWSDRVRAYDAEQRKRKAEEDEQRRREALEVIRQMLLRHINATDVEPSASSQIQAAKLLLEHYVAADQMRQLEEKFEQLRERVRSLGIDI